MVPEGADVTPLSRVPEGADVTPLPRVPEGADVTLLSRVPEIVTILLVVAVGLGTTSWRFEVDVESVHVVLETGAGSVEGQGTKHVYVHMS